MKVAVLGANGQLGQEICRVLKERGEDAIPLTHQDIEVSNMDSVHEALNQIRPDAIINTSAMHNVEACEADPQQSFMVNAWGARNLALEANELSALLIHISTDYVFDGKKNSPYLEEDSAIPLNVYGNTKLSGELFIQSTAKRYFILRTSGLYGQFPCRAKSSPNFVKRMLDLAKKGKEIRVANDELLTPTWTMDLAKQIGVLLRHEQYGVCHATAEGQCSWYDFVKEIFHVTGNNVHLNIADSSDLPQKVNRPKYSVLENGQLKKMALNSFLPWQEALCQFLQSE